MGSEDGDNGTCGGSNYLGLLHVVTRGQNGPLLGSDEQEITLFSIAVLQVDVNEVVLKKDYRVKPEDKSLSEEDSTNSEKSSSSLSGDNNDENENRMVDAKLLHEVIPIIEKDLEPYIESLCFVTTGPLPLRQCIHPQVSNKDIPLHPVFNEFFDLQKEFNQKYSKEGDDPMDLLQMGQFLELEDFPNCALDCKVDEMALIVQRMVTDGHKFQKPDIIKLKLEPGICSKNEIIDGNTIVRARGLPWQSSDQDIAKFFRGLNIAKGGVALCLSAQGRRNGEALVRFESEQHRDLALKRHKHHLQNRYIEVYKASGEDFLAVAGGNNNEAQAFLSKGGQAIIRMRGLPYDCVAKQVLEFFQSGDNGCDVLEGEEGVLFVKRVDGRATGDAFVLFATEEDAQKALSKHKESIGSRYIELFRSTTAEVQQVLNRCLVSEPLISNKQSGTPVSVTSSLSEPLSLNATHNQGSGPLHLNHSLVVSPVVSPAAAAAAAAAANNPVLPPHVITSGTRKDCIRLRGLPYEAQVEHILDFLGEYAKHIVYQGVHMVYNAQGQPSGEAFIQMDNETSAFLTAQAKHNRFMTYFKKQRYIEVFQCSGEDMNMVLTGPQSNVTGPLSLGLAAGLQTSPTLPGGKQAGVGAPGLYPSYMYGTHHHIMRNQGYGYTPVFYWPSYVSPPLSPSAHHHYYHTNAMQQSLLPLGPDLKTTYEVIPTNPHHHHHHHITSPARLEYLDRSPLIEKRLPMQHEMGIFIA